MSKLHTQKKKENNMNSVNLTGRLTRDPEVKQTQSGQSVATFTLAVDRSFKNKDGQKECDFIQHVFWGKSAELVGQYLSKGSQVGTSGRLQIRSYEAQDGTKRYVTEIIGNELTFLSGGSNEQKQQAPKREEAAYNEIPEDDIPF